MSVTDDKHVVTESQDSDAKNAPAAAKAIVQAVTALAGAGIGGPPGAVLGAATAELLMPLAAEAWRELNERRAASVGRLIETASATSDKDPEALLACAQARQETAQLLLDTMSAASESLLEWKVDALAKALANGLEGDGARVDEERLVVRAIADLEPPHVRALSLLASSTSALQSDAIQSTVGVTDAGAVMPVLVRHGLAEEPRREGLTVGDPPLSWQLTTFGRAVFAYLAGASAGSSPG